MLTKYYFIIHRWSWDKKSSAATNLVIKTKKWQMKAKLTDFMSSIYLKVFYTYLRKWTESITNLTVVYVYGLVTGMYLYSSKVKKSPRATSLKHKNIKIICNCCLSTIVNKVTHSCCIVRKTFIVDSFLLLIIKTFEFRYKMRELFVLPQRRNGIRRKTATGRDRSEKTGRTFFTPGTITRNGEIRDRWFEWRQSSLEK